MLDRELQRKILEGLAKEYPAKVYDIAKSLDLGCDKRTLIANVSYLREHRLLLGGFQDGKMIGHVPVEQRFIENGTAITADGMDFLANDGGLGAILNVVTVRIDAAQFTELLARKVETLPNVNPEA